MKHANDSLGYVCCPVENRQALLQELLSVYYDQKDNAWNKKVVVVFCHDNCVRFYTELLQRMQQLPIMPLLKSNLTSAGGLDDYALFQDSETGVMAVSTTVALRLEGLSADKIIQFEPPHSADAVYELSSQCSDYLLFLRPQELSFLDHLKLNRDNFALEERYVPWDNVPRMPKQKVQHWYKNLHSMNINSKASYKAYMDVIRDHSLSDVFNLNNVLIKEVAEGYCFVVPPFYKLVKETPRYEQEIARKEEMAATQVIPRTAKVVKTTFKRVVRKGEDDNEVIKRKRQSRKDKKHAKKARYVRDDQVEFDESGAVELGRDKQVEREYTHTRVRLLKAKKADKRGLKKQLAMVAGVKRSSSRAGAKRRRPIKIPQRMR